MQILPHQRIDWASAGLVSLVALAMLIALLGNGGWVIPVLVAVMLVHLGAVAVGLGLLAFALWYVVQHPRRRLRPLDVHQPAAHWLVVAQAPRPRHLDRHGPSHGHGRAA